ncbi:MAG: ribonuclease [Firmicutes bacterium]|nr:ribonuclease [Bacillota bacterium]
MDTIEKTAQTVQQIAEVLNDTEEDTESAALPASEAQEPAEEASEEPAQASDQETAAEEPAEAAAETPAIDEDGVYTTKDDVALYLHTYGHLPSNFITKKEAEKLGWSGGSLEPYAPGKCIGGSHFGNYEGILPEKDGRSYTECDIDTLGAGSRGAKRIVFSNDGLIYYTEDHYETFELLYGEES